MTTLTAISGPLVGYANLAPRPHGDQAVPVLPPVNPNAPPSLAPAQTAELDYKGARVEGKNDLNYYNPRSRKGDLEFRDGSEV